VLVQIYRGVVGPGMSTYMEAFPVMPSSAHSVQPTPPPMTGPVHVGSPNAPTIAATGPSGSAPVVASSSGVYTGASVAGPKKSKAGLIIAVLAVLAVGGGVAAFVVASNKPEPKGPGSGSQVVIKDGSNERPDRGSNHGGNDGSAGSATIPQSGSDSGSD